MVFDFKLKYSDKKYLLELTKSRSCITGNLKYAYVLLALADGKPIETIGEFYRVSRTTIWRIRDRYLKFGLAIFSVKERKVRIKKYNAQDEESLVRLTTTVPPEGKNHWTVQLLIASLEKNNELKKMNRETVRLLLKKNKIKLKRK